VDLRETPLDVTEVLDAVSGRAVGGIDVFVGTVRDHDHEQGVTGLEYSAHPTALARLQEVVAGVAERYDVLAVAAVHRVGRLEIGDAAVIVATSAAHRGEAFRATRALIDELKDTVPIWKHQLFEDGSDEWVGTP
jgi:molybdopterin synthase catalytic subunit